MKIKLVCITWLILFFLSSCSFTNVTTTSSISETASPGSFGRPTEDINSSPVQNSTESITVKPTKIQEIPEWGATDSIIMKQCSNQALPAKFSREFGIQGSLILVDETNKILLASGTPINYSELPITSDQIIESLGFNQDGNIFAYSSLPVNTDQGKFASVIHLVSREGSLYEQQLNLSKFEHQIPDGMTLIGIRGQGNKWINNDFIHLHILYQNEEGMKRIYYYDALLNPKRNLWMEDTYYEIPDNRAFQDVSFSPDLTRALFADREGITLADLKGKKDQWEFEHKLFNSMIGPIYSWRLDSSQAIFSTQDEEYQAFYILDRDGKNINKVMPPAIINSDWNYSIIDFEWSPDGNSIAISAKVTNSIDSMSYSMLFIYDLSLKNYTYQCQLENFITSPLISWSPDNRYVVPYLPGTLSPLVLYDTKGSLMVIKIKEKVIFGGWTENW